MKISVFFKFNVTMFRKNKIITKYLKANIIQTIFKEKKKTDNKTIFFKLVRN